MNDYLIPAGSSSNRFVRLSEIEAHNVRVDLSSVRCGSFGCTFLLQTANAKQKKKLVKIGVVDELETRIAIEMSTKGVGVQVYGYFDVALLSETEPTENGVAIIMEYYDGTLDRLIIDKPAKLAALETLFSKTIAAGLIHGDLKADNVVWRKLRDGYDFRLIDFGFSKLVNPEIKELFYVQQLLLVADWFVVGSFLAYARDQYRNGNIEEAIANGNTAKTMGLLPDLVARSESAAENIFFIGRVRAWIGAVLENYGVLYSQLGPGEAESNGILTVGDISPF